MFRFGIQIEKSNMNEAEDWFGIHTVQQQQLLLALHPTHLEAFYLTLGYNGFFSLHSLGSFEVESFLAF